MWYNIVSQLIIPFLINVHIKDYFYLISYTQPSPILKVVKSPRAYL